MATVGVVGDLHIPAVHPGYMQFILDTFWEWDVDRVVFIGDVVDQHWFSRHLKSPEMLLGPVGEYDVAVDQVAEWHGQLPNADVMVGNHDDWIYNRAAEAGIPRKLMHSYKHFWQTPTWVWRSQVIIDDVFYHHGHGCGGGMNASSNLSKEVGKSTVIGHNHSLHGIKWRTTRLGSLFGLDVGCGVDPASPHMAYGAGNVRKQPVLGCAIVQDGVGTPVKMPCARGQLYHRSNF